MARVANYEEIYRFLRNGSLSDAKHDFTDGKKRVLTEAHYTVIKSGLYDDPTIETVATSEDSLLDSIFEGITMDAIKTNVKASAEKKINIDVKGLVPSKYTVKVLHKGPVTNVDKIISGKLLTVTDMKDFFNSTIINLLIDASAIGIMELISSLKAVAGAEKIFINLIFNRESINDPGGKITEFKKIDSAVKSLLATDILIDRDVSEIFYKKNSDGLDHTPLERDKFFSKYDFKMGPVMYQENKAGSIKSKFVSARVDVLDGSKILYTANDKNNNSITNCWKLIMLFFTKNDILASIIFQMKRTGDWLQALSCLDLKRNYGSVKSGKIDLINGVITLITHDKILLAYALFIGLDVIFTNIHNGEKNIFYFYNNTSETRLSPADLAKYLEGIAEELQKKRAEEDRKILEAVQAYLSGPLEAHLKFMAQYMQWVREIKDTREDSIKKALEQTKRDGTNIYFKKLWEYTAINYENFDETKKTLNSLHEEYKKLPTPETGKRLLAIKANLDTYKDYTKKGIEDTSRGYIDDAGYKIMDSPKTIVRGREINNAIKRLLAMIDKYSKELPLKLFKEFQEILFKWSTEDLKENSDYLVHILAVLVKSVKSVYEDEPEAPAEAPAEAQAPVSLAETDAEILAGLANSLVPEDGEIIEGTQVLGALAQLIADYRYVDILEDGEVLNGGGERQVKSNYLTNIGFSFLINIYLNKIYSNLSNIDSDNNFDYDYYKQLIIYIQIYFKRFPGARDRVFILYNILSTNHNLPVVYLASQISTEAIGGSGKAILKIAPKRFIIKADELKQEVSNAFKNYGLFSRSKRRLLKYLEEQFELIKIQYADEADLLGTPNRAKVSTRKRDRMLETTERANRSKTAKRGRSHSLSGISEPMEVV